MFRQRLLDIPAVGAHSCVYAVKRHTRETGSYLAAARRVCVYVALQHMQVSRLSSSEFVIMRERTTEREEEKKEERTGRIPSSRRHNDSSIFSFFLPSISFIVRFRCVFDSFT